ncbi:hypothetical protein V6N13_013034 [Hibiscus sabdariffa]
MAWICNQAEIMNQQPKVLLHEYVPNTLVVTSYRTWQWKPGIHGTCFKSLNPIQEYRKDAHTTVFGEQRGKLLTKEQRKWR